MDVDPLRNRADHEPGASVSAGALTHLHPVFVALLPELGKLELEPEARADCTSCVMLPERFGSTAHHPWAFNPITRCCTYHPELPNFLVGRALQRGGQGADRIRERLLDVSGVSAWGIMPSDGFRASRAASTVGFGRDPAMRCPFWVGGTHTCGVWHDRNAVCRTWFCKHGQGVVALARWTALRKALTLMERRLAELCVQAGEPPDGADGPEAWEAWFVACAERVDSLSTEELGALRTAELHEVKRQLMACMNVPAPYLPDVVVPVIRRYVTTPAGLGLEGYSSYDGIEVDPRIVHFFAALDGQQSWRQALEHTRDACGNTVDEALVRELHRVDILQSPARIIEYAREQGIAPLPEATAGLPELLTPAVQRPITVGEEVWLQGEVPLASVVAPRAIFWFFSRLDGQTPWRKVHSRMKAEHAHAVDEALIARLYAIGALREPRPGPDSDDPGHTSSR